MYGFPKRLKPISGIESGVLNSEGYLGTGILQAVMVPNCDLDITHNWETTLWTAPLVWCFRGWPTAAAPFPNLRWWVPWSVSMQMELCFLEAKWGVLHCWRSVVTGNGRRTLAQHLSCWQSTNPALVFGFNQTSEHLVDQNNFHYCQFCLLCLFIVFMFVKNCWPETTSGMVTADLLLPVQCYLSLLQGKSSQLCPCTSTIWFPPYYSKFHARMRETRWSHETLG